MHSARYVFLNIFKYSINRNVTQQGNLRIGIVPGGDFHESEVCQYRFANIPAIKLRKKMKRIKRKVEWLEKAHRERYQFTGNDTSLPGTTILPGGTPRHEINMPGVPDVRN